MNFCGTIIKDNILESTKNFELEDAWKDFDLPELLFFLARNHVDRRGPDLVWIQDGLSKKKILMRDLEPAARRLARVLSSKGVRPGDMVTLLEDSLIQAPVLAIATWLCGGVFNTMDPYLHQTVVANSIQLSKPKLILTSDPFHWKVKDYCAKHNVPVWLNDEPGNFVQIVSSEETPEEETAALPRKPRSNPSDLALILWTSGSTGFPKGIKLPFSALINQCLRQWKAPLSNQKNSETTFLVGTRMFHFSGMIFSLCAPADTGPYTTLFINNEGLSMEQLGELIAEFKPLGMMIPYHHTIRFSDQNYDWSRMSSLKVILPAGARVGKVIEAELKAKIPGVQLSNVYGSIETGGSVSGSLTQEHVGHLYPNTKVKIRDLTTDEVCGPGELGEVCVKNDKMLLGYLGQENKKFIDSDGFYRMGDVGMFDEQGRLYYIDRVKDLMELNGYSFYPVTLEKILDSHTDVLQSCVFGLSNKPGTSCLALVIPRAGAVLDCHQIRDWANERLDGQCQLQEVREAPYVPTTTMGKKSRRDCEKIWKKKTTIDRQSYASYQDTSADDYIK